MKHFRKQLEMLTKLALSEDPSEQKQLRNTLRETLRTMKTPETIEDVLTELGIPDSQIGYRYMAQAIRIQMERDSTVPFGSVLWPAVAKEFGVSTMAVERGCRTCLDTAFARVDHEVVEKYFGGAIDPDRGRPTLRHFITRIANLLKEDPK